MHNILVDISDFSNSLECPNSRPIIEPKPTENNHALTFAHPHDNFWCDNVTKGTLGKQSLFLE